MTINTSKQETITAEFSAEDIEQILVEKAKEAAKYRDSQAFESISTKYKTNKAGNMLQATVTLLNPTNVISEAR